MHCECNEQYIHNYMYLYFFTLLLRVSTTTVSHHQGVKVKVSSDRPRWPEGFRQVKTPDILDFRHYERGKVVTLTHRPSLPPGVFLVLIFRG